MFCCLLSMNDIILFSSTHQGCLIATQCSIFKSTTLKIVLLVVKNVYRLSFFSKWVITHDTFVKKKLYLSSSCILFWLVKHVFTLPAMFTGKGRYCGLVLVSDNTILYLCFYKVKHFVNIDESYFWAAWIFANLSPADSLNRSLTTWSYASSAHVFKCLHVNVAENKHILFFHLYLKWNTKAFICNVL